MVYLLFIPTLIIISLMPISAQTDTINPIDQPNNLDVTGKCVISRADNTQLVQVCYPSHKPTKKGKKPWKGYGRIVR